MGDEGYEGYEGYLNSVVVSDILPKKIIKDFHILAILAAVEKILEFSKYITFKALKSGTFNPKKTQGEETQEFKNSRKKLKNPQINFPA